MWDNSKKKTRILFIAASPQDTTKLELEQEYNDIESELQRSKYRDDFEFERRFAVSVVDLQRLLLQSKPDVVHFSGHGTEKGALFFEDRAGFVEELSPNALANLFEVVNRDDNSIRCVILDACYSEVQAKGIGKHVDCIIGMSAAISERAATKFATSFYRSLGFAKSVKDAFDLGRNQLELESTSEEKTPKLHCKAGIDASKIFYAGPSAPGRRTDRLEASKGGRSIFADRKREILIAVIAGPLATIIALAWPAVAQFVEDAGEPSIINLGFAEDCESFSPESIVVSKIDQDWFIVDESQGFELLDFKTNKDSADRGAGVIREYGFNKMCFVGRPYNSINNPVLPMMYFLVNGTSAITIQDSEDTAAGQDCRVLSTDGISAREVNDKWLVLDHNVKIYDFGNYQKSKENAERGAEVIRGYGFDRLCLIERPFQSMMYFLKGSSDRGVLPTGESTDPSSTILNAGGDSENMQVHFVYDNKIFFISKIFPEPAYADIMSCGPNNATMAQPGFNATSTNVNDASAPSLGITSHAEGDYVRPTFTLEGVAEDEGTGVSLVEVLIITPNASLYELATPRSQDDWSDWSFNVSGLSAGFYYIQVRAMDLACNQHTLPPIRLTIDTQPPTLSMPDNLILEATGSQGVTSTYVVSAQDNSAQVGTPDCSPPSGTIFHFGTTTVVCTVTDEAGNVVEGMFNVTVRDTTPPALMMPTDIRVQANSQSGRTVNYLASATDTVGGSMTPNCSPPSGSTFAVGITTVTCSVADADGNGVTGSFIITVEDQVEQVVNLAPNAHAGRDQTVSAGSHVRLDGALSYDTDGDISNIEWSQSSGVAVSLTDTNTIHPFFTAPQVSAGAAQDLQFRIKVTDNQGLTDTDVVRITVTSSHFNLHSTLDGNSYDLSGNSSDVIPTSFTIEPNNSSIRIDLVESGNSAERVVELHFQGEMITGIYEVRTDKGENISFETIASNSDSQLIRINIPPNTSYIEIGATRVIPEFSSLIFIMVALLSMVLTLAAIYKADNHKHRMSD